MMSVEIKINEKTIKKFVAVRREQFKGPGAMHTYDVTMIEALAVHNHHGLYCGKDRDESFTVGTIKHRYSDGGVSLTEKMLKLAGKQGMSR